MATLNYMLKSPKQSKETPIILYVSSKGKGIKLSPGIRVKPRDWSKRHKRVNDSAIQSESKNQALAAYKERVGAIVLTLESQGHTLSGNLIRTYLNRELPSPGKVGFWDAYSTYETLKTRTASDNHSANIKGLATLLKRFHESTGFRIGFDTITPEFWDLFTEFRSKEDISDSSIDKSFRILKAFLNWATNEREYNTNLAYLKIKTIKFKAPDMPALSQAQLDAIQRAELPETLHRFRDMFVLQCYTGMRYSDVENLRWINIQESESGPYLDYISIKTKEHIFGASLHPIAHGIALKYKPLDRIQKGRIFPKTTNQEYNRRLKKIGKLAEITTPVQIARQASGKLSKSTKPLYELITTHTGRRTFITLWIENGGDLSSLSIHTGHKSLKELQKYWKKSKEHRLKLSKHPGRR